MPKVYCPSCGKSTSYETVKVRFCSHCGYEMSKAFVTIPTNDIGRPQAKPRPIQVDTEDSEIREESRNRPITRSTSISSHRNVSSFRHTHEKEETVGDEEHGGPISREDYVNQEEVRASAQELAALIDASDFMIEADNSSVVKLKNLVPDIDKKLSEKNNS